LANYFDPEVPNANRDDPVAYSRLG